MNCPHCSLPLAQPIEMKKNAGGYTCGFYCSGCGSGLFVAVSTIQQPTRPNFKHNLADNKKAS